MKTTILKHQFIDAINKAIPGSFSLEGAEALFDYLTEIEEGTGQEYELDPIGIRCEFTEYESYKELLKDYSEYSIEELKDTTRVIELTHGGVLIEQF